MIYDFTSKPKKIQDGVIPERVPAISPEPYAPDPVERVNEKLYDLTNRQPNDVQSLLVPGFKALDDGIKRWIDGIAVPATDGMKRLTARVAGGDKTLLFWKQDLKSGRIKLPICSINRTSWRFFEQKYSPAFLPATRGFTDRYGTHVRLTYRPWPALVDYQLSIWAEWKPDIEYIQYQIVTRFDPLAEIDIDDEHLRGRVQIKLNNVTDSSDKETDAENRAEVRYDIDISCEAWLPHPSRIVPTVLGHVGTLHEFDGTFLDIIGKNSISSHQFDLGSESN